MAERGSDSLVGHVSRLSETIPRIIINLYAPHSVVLVTVERSTAPRGRLGSGYMLALSVVVSGARVRLFAGDGTSEFGVRQKK